MPGGPKTRNRDLAAVALAAGQDIDAAATAAGVSGRTIDNWLTDPEFRGRVDDLRNAMIDATAGRLSASMTRSADVLAELLGDDDANVRHRSAAKIIELGLKATELRELVRRVSLIEDMITKREKETAT